MAQYLGRRVRPRSHVSPAFEPMHAGMLHGTRLPLLAAQHQLRSCRSASRNCCHHTALTTATPTFTPRSKAMRGR